MHIFPVISFVLALMVMVCFAGCTPHIYGVPQPQWEQLSQGQRDEAVKGYNERERIREQARQAEAVRMAQEAEVRAAEARRQEELMRKRVEGIYAGTAGQFGDLIQVTISGGQMFIAWGHQNYQPMAFKIANGETKTIDIVEITSPYVKPSRTELLVKYQDGLLLVDGNNGSWDRSARLLYDQAWRRGSSYVVNSREKKELRNVKIGVTVIPHLLHTKVR